MDDGFGDFTFVRREYTSPRADQGSRVLEAIPGGTVTGPAVRIHIVHIVATDGIEIEIPSPNRPEKNILGHDMPRNESSCGRNTYSEPGM